jgi:di/tricarboxylate transporter
LGIFIAVISAMSLTSFFPSLDEIRFFREFLDPVSVSIVGAVLMVVTGCVSSTDAHRSIQLSVILLVGSALGLSTALTSSKADIWLAESIGSIFQGSSPTVMLAVLYFLTWILSEFLSNNATAAMMAALSLAIAQQMGVDPRPFLIGVTIAASCAFATPIGYQTNLMVLGPGGYRFIDYVKVGLPLNFICMIVAVILIPWIWPFVPVPAIP